MRRRRCRQAALRAQVCLARSPAVDWYKRRKALIEPLSSPTLPPAAASGIPGGGAARPPTCTLPLVWCPSKKPSPSARRPCSCPCSSSLLVAAERSHFCASCLRQLAGWQLQVQLALPLGCSAPCPARLLGIYSACWLAAGLRGWAGAHTRDAPAGSARRATATLPQLPVQPRRKHCSPAPIPFSSRGCSAPCPGCRQQTGTEGRSNPQCFPEQGLYRPAFPILLPT